MDFERHRDPKESMKLGVKANAPLIRGFYSTHNVSIDFNTGIQQKEISIVNPEEVNAVLTLISKKHMSPDGFCFQTESDEAGKLHYLSDWAGKYVKYQNRGFVVSCYEEQNDGNLYIYFIPEE